MEIEDERQITHRIDQIVELAVQGHRDKAIAHQLGVKVSTVTTYWERLYARVGQTSRTAAVITYLRSKLEAQSRQLREANIALHDLHEGNQRAMAGILTDLQERLAKAEHGARSFDFLERANNIAHAAAYELASVNPVRYHRLSSSATRLGMDVEAFLQGKNTFYKHVHPDDLPLLLQASLGAEWRPEERYVFLYRMMMPEARWVMDTHQAQYNEEGEMQSILGVAIDIHDLILAGVIKPAVVRIVIPIASYA